MLKQETAPRPTSAPSRAATTKPGDALVIFGITGDLAKVMTLRSLYRLERRGLLNCPIIGVAVDDWSTDRLRQHAQKAIVDGGERLDPQVFDRLAARLSYISGNFSDAATYARLASALKGIETPVFYLEIPPFLFGDLVKGLADAGLTGGARVVVEKPFGHDAASAAELNGQMHQYIAEDQLYRIDHFLGKMGLQEILYLRFANTMLEPVWSRHYVDCVQITMAEDFGVEDRGHFYDPVGAVRDVMVNHLMQLLAAAAMEAPAGADPATIKDAKYAVFRSMADADPARYVRGQYEGYRAIAGVKPDSNTETFAALQLEIDNWRWSGVPFFLRAGKRLPTTQTEIRVVFNRPPRLGFVHSRQRRPDPGQLVIKLDPSTGIRLKLSGLRSSSEHPELINLDMEFAAEGGEAAAPYEVLLLDALQGNSARFTRQDSIEEAWRIFEPLLASNGPAHSYAPGTWGPDASQQLTAKYGGWHGPWLAE